MEIEIEDEVEVEDEDENGFDPFCPLVDIWKNKDKNFSGYLPVQRNRNRKRNRNRR